eukprot:5012605-Prymnesium_polylepis.1
MRSQFSRRESAASTSPPAQTGVHAPAMVRHAHSIGRDAVVERRLLCLSTRVGVVRPCIAAAARRMEERRQPLLSESGTPMR